MSPYTKEMLEAQIKHWQREAERQRRARLLEAFIGLIVLGALISFTIWYAGWKQAQADSRWCDLIVPIDDRQQTITNPTPDQKEFADRMHTLRRKLHC